jgi:hypothetical protein
MIVMQNLRYSVYPLIYTCVLVVLVIYCVHVVLVKYICTQICVC